MATFEDLPNENIIEVIRFVKPPNLRGIRIAHDTLCSLRLVSQRLNTLVCPILFETLRLEFWDTNDYLKTKDHTRCNEILNALATRSTTLFKRHTRKLVFRTEKLFWTHESKMQGIAVTKRFLSQRISDIISALNNLRSIEYFYNPIFDPKELAVDLIHALSTLPSFKHLNLQFIDNRGWYANTPQSMTLQPLSNLTVFRIVWGQTKPKAFLLEIASLLARCPNMIELRLDQLNEKGATLHEILQDIDTLETEWKLEKLILKGVVVTPEDVKGHIHHFKNLSVLEVSINDNPKASTVLGQICKALQENEVFLKGILTDHPEDPLLLQYLASYPGLRKLCLHMEDGKTSLETETEILNQVYTRIIPKHFETLEHLELGSRETRIWVAIPQREHLLDLARCQKLTVLEVHSKIHLDELRNGCRNDDDLDRYIASLVEKSPFEMILNRIRRAGIY